MLLKHTLSMPKCPMVALFFWVLAICSRESYSGQFLLHRHVIDFLQNTDILCCSISYLGLNLGNLLHSRHCCNVVCTTANAPFQQSNTAYTQLTRNTCYIWIMIKLTCVCCRFFSLILMWENARQERLCTAWYAPSQVHEAASPLVATLAISSIVSLYSQYICNSRHPEVWVEPVRGLKPTGPMHLQGR